MDTTSTVGGATTSTVTATGGASDVVSPSLAISSNTVSPTGDTGRSGQASANVTVSKSSVNPTSVQSSPTTDNVQDATITSTQPSGSGSSSWKTSTYDSDAASTSASIARLVDSPALSNETSDSAYNPSIAGWPFNSTVTFTLDSLSPMLDLDVATPFRIDPKTGYRIYESYGGLGQMSLRFVGVGYSINGLSGMGRTSNDPLEYQVSNKLYKIPRAGRELRQSWTPGDHGLGATSDLDLRSYQVNASFGLGGSNVTFYNATIEVPIKTQAALLSQANKISVTDGTNLNPYITTAFCTVYDDLNVRWNLSHPDGPPVLIAGVEPSGRYDVADGRVLLMTSTEIIYSVPPNTTLVEVLGPSGNQRFWEGDSICYAFLNPRPKWWQSPNYPTSISRKGINATDQSMFILPIDPETEYELRVGSYGEGTTCPVSGIRTYPFHYNFTKDLVSSQTNATGVGSGAANNQRTNATPTIVGAVIGAVGGLALIGLVVWYFRRARRHRAEKEKELLPNPYSDDGTGEPRTKEALGRMARGEDPDAPAAAAQQSSGNEQTAGPSRRVLVQEEDGQTIFEYLPPQYREDWQVGAASGSRHTPDARQRADTRQPYGGAAPMREASAAPVTDPALRAKVDHFANADRPALKQEYTRAFPRTLPRPPQSPSGPRPSGADASELNLRDEYKQRFGSSARYSNLRRSAALSNSTPSETDQPLSPDSASSAGEAGPSHNDYDLREEYKKWFS